MATDLEKAYAAGLFDGEGCVQLYMRPSSRTRGSLTMALSMSSVDATPMVWLKERWGGSLKVYDEPWRQGRGFRPLHRWMIYSKEAEAFANDIFPYSLTKRSQLKLWLEARSMLLPFRGGSGISDEEFATRIDLVERVKQLKRVS